jgi:serine phosphatase RsbU (regulator of sigma subunit)
LPGMIPPLNSPTDRISAGCALVATIIGAVTIVGWFTGIEALASVRAHYIPMAPSTGLAFALLGFAIIVRSSGGLWRFACLLCAGIVALVATAKLIEFFAGVSFGLEELLVADPAMFGAVRKGRMAPMTALSFLLATISLFCVMRPKWRRWAGGVATLVAAISVVVILGYLHGTPLLYGGNIIPVALPTAVAFLLIGSSLISAAGVACWPLLPLTNSSARSVLLRWFLPVVVAGTILNGYLRTRLLDESHLNPALISALSTLGFMIVISAIISQVARIVGGRIDRAEAERNLAQAELKALNADLERRILERTRELQAKNEQMQEELTMARELQLALLPTHFPTVPKSAFDQDSAIRFFTFYYPTGSVSGDFFDVFSVSEMSVGVFICDVMGHGVRSALVTSMMRALLEQHRGKASDPGELLTRINRGLVSILKSTETTMFATSFVLIADLERSELTFANAGHPSPLHIRKSECRTVPLAVKGTSGPALGMFDGATYRTARSEMSVGDMIMLFTDGLFEVENAEAELFSQEQLLNTVQERCTLPPEKLFAGVLAEIRRFTGRYEFEDDVCLVGIEVARLPEAVSARALVS